MNAPLDLRMDNRTFLHWMQGREGRFELDRGRVVQQMTGGSRNHFILAGRFVSALATRLDPGRWNVGATDLAVEVGDSVRYPDVMVEPAGMDGQALSSTQAVVLVEVLSPSSVVRDLQTKLAEYTTLPALEAYIVASQDEPILWLWQRSRDAARSFPAEPEEVNGRSGVVTLASLGVKLAMADLYAGIGRMP